MPIIDLDSRRPAGPDRSIRWDPRLLVGVAAGLILLSLPGEPAASPGCPATRSSAATPYSATVLLDAETGEVLRTVAC